MIVVRARDFKINSNRMRIYTHTRTTSSLYLGPARDVNLEKRQDVCVHTKRVSKITLSRTHDQ